VSAQREIGRGFLVDVGYIGNHAKNLLIINDQNLCHTPLADSGNAAERT
jgi:hypothetical protein